MAADHTLSATTRTEFGKGAARRLRRAGQTPAVLYGHGTDPVHLALPARETYLALRTANVLLEITVDGSDKPVLALPKQIHRDPILPAIDHIDLLLVKAGEKVEVEVALELEGNVINGGLVNHDLTALPVLAPASDIPSLITLSVAGLAVGAHLTVADLTLPEGVEAAVDGETLVLSIVPAPTEEAAPAAEGTEAAE